MNFVSLTYAVFLLVVVIGYWLVPRRAGRYWLIVASLVFYGSWNAWYVPGFVALILANYALGRLAAGPRRRLAVALAIAVDLGLLAIFKYLDWAVASGTSLLQQLTGTELEVTALNLILPLAISFVTFTMLAYVIDIARGGQPERRLTNFALFVTFFPHLIAGPIMRAREFLPQIRHPRPFRVRHLRLALPFLVGGLLKKVIADGLAPIVATTFADPDAVSTAGLWAGAVAFAFQILFDFSGYTDLALGSAYLLGFELPRNFNWPYRAASIQEFWRRWHMTLSRWLRDYVYIPLGGSRHGLARMYAALLITMFVGGLWHGAGWTFVVWGLWHGGGLVVQRWFGGLRTGPSPIPMLLAWAMTFLFVLVGWVFFRATSMENALAYLGGMFQLRAGQSPVPVVIAVALLVGVALQWAAVARLGARIAPPGSLRRYGSFGLAILAGVLLMPVVIPDFIYFQF
jgi:alginate O-acetyltransferase complex protein AlgI